MALPSTGPARFPAIGVEALGLAQSAAIGVEANPRANRKPKTEHVPFRTVAAADITLDRTGRGPPRPGRGRSGQLPRRPSHHSLDLTGRGPPRRPKRFFRGTIAPARQPEESGLEGELVAYPAGGLPFDPLPSRNVRERTNATETEKDVLESF